MQHVRTHAWIPTERWTNRIAVSVLPPATSFRQKSQQSLNGAFDASILDSIQKRRLHTFETIVLKYFGSDIRTRYRRLSNLPVEIYWTSMMTSTSKNAGWTPLAPTNPNVPVGAEIVYKFFGSFHDDGLESVHFFCGIKRLRYQTPGQACMPWTSISKTSTVNCQPSQ